MQRDLLDILLEKVEPYTHLQPSIAMYLAWHVCHCVLHSSQAPKLQTRSLHTWSHKISEFEKTKKYASDHDLRRSFLDQWSDKDDAGVLQILARHESLSTTQAYYLSDQAHLGNLIDKELSGDSVGVAHFHIG